jgi:hypothetical protein
VGAPVVLSTGCPEHRLDLRTGCPGLRRDW